MPDSAKTVTIVGAGRLAGALSIALCNASVPVETVYFHRKFPEILKERLPQTKFKPFPPKETINSDTVIIAVRDDAIEEAAHELIPFLTPHRTVLHTSGSLTSSILDPLFRSGHATGSFHPLISVSDVLTGSNFFHGAYICIEGTETAKSNAFELANRLGANSFGILPEKKSLYHLAAMIASGYLITLMSVAEELFLECGINETFAKQLTLNLSKSSIENYSHQSAEQALTGPIARADIETYKRHIKALDKLNDPELKRLYLAIAVYSARLAARREITKEERERLQALEQQIILDKAESE